MWAEVCLQDGEAATLGDADLVRLGTVFCSEHPQFGSVRQVGPLVRLADAVRPTPLPAPVAHEHTEAVLGELGLSREEIQGLRDRQVVK